MYFHKLCRGQRRFEVVGDPLFCLTVYSSLELWGCLSIWKREILQYCLLVACCYHLIAEEVRAR